MSVLAFPPPHYPYVATLLILLAVFPPLALMVVRTQGHRRIVLVSRIVFVYAIFGALIAPMIVRSVTRRGAIQTLAQDSLIMLPLTLSLCLLVWQKYPKQPSEPADPPTSKSE